MARERLGWVDLAKVVSIGLVTSYHTAPALTGYTAALVQLLRMPAFFLIAGLLFDDRRFASLPALLRHRARQLLVPYVAFEALLIALTCHGWPSVREAVANALLGHPTTCYPLWFLVCLFGMQVLHYLGTRLTTLLTHADWTHHRLALCGAYILVGAVLAHFELPQHFQLNAIVQNLPFYAAANCAKSTIHAVSWRRYTTTAACLAGGLLLVWVKWAMLSPGLSWAGDALYYGVHLAAGLLLLPPYIATCKAVASATGRLRLLEYLGSNTVVILALHTYLIKALTAAIGLPILEGHAWLNPVLTVVVVLTHLPIIWAINRWTPWLLGRGHQTAAR